VGCEAVKDLVDRAQMEPHEVAIVARDPMAFGHLLRLASDLRNALQLAG